MRSLEWPGASAVAQHHSYCDVQTSDRDINANSVWAIIEIVQVFATCGIADIRTTSTVAQKISIVAIEGSVATKFALLK